MRSEATPHTARAEGTNTSPSTWVERHSGQLREDPIYARAFLDWCYNTRAGRGLTRMLLSRKWVSHIYGWYYTQPWTRRKIGPFARAMGVNLGEITQPLASFRSFADFITRNIDLSQRPIDPDPCICVSPADGRLVAYQTVPAGKAFPIKGGLFDLQALLCDDSLSRHYSGGSVAILRLYLADYHHFHFPDSGAPCESRPLAGRYFAVTPYARRLAVPFYGENRRVLTLFHSDHFGRIAMIDVGAFTVGSIRQTFVPGARVAKGAHKGYFELGGSLIVLLFEGGTIRFDADLCRNTQAGLETFVRLGESIGRYPGGNIDDSTRKPSIGAA